MYICICNALTEKDIKNMCPKEYEKIVQCGMCKPFVEEIFKKEKNDDSTRSDIITSDK